jgi:hypothetical protein
MGEPGADHIFVFVLFIARVVGAFEQLFLRFGCHACVLDGFARMSSSFAVTTKE